MTIQEQIIRGQGFCYFQDVALWNKALTRPQAISWLRLAEKWAAKHHAPELIREIEGYLAELKTSPEAPVDEGTPALALEVA